MRLLPKTKLFNIAHTRTRISLYSPNMSMLAERVLAQLQISTGPSGSPIAALAKALDEPAVFVRFALERLRDQGIVFRRGGWWSAAGI
jgi:CRP-like cAMP-binding protein